MQKLARTYDCVVIGAGHNGLVAAAYLAQAGKSVCVLERREIVGGAAVTEQIVPGFKFSRASYLLSLLRPRIIKDLELHSNGLQLLPRNPSSYTPILGQEKALQLGDCPLKNKMSIAQFSSADANIYCKYEAEMQKLASGIEPLLDAPPVNLHKLLSASATTTTTAGRWREMKRTVPLMKCLLQLGSSIPQMYKLLTSPTQKILDSWFESECLKATLATDSVIGAMTTPHIAGSGYVLLHHVMGGVDGVSGAWAFVKGGMGAVSDAIAAAAVARGAKIFTNSEVKEIKVSNGKVQGVLLNDGVEINAELVLSNATPAVTFEKLISNNHLPTEFLSEVKQIDYSSPVTKINIAVSRLPTFLADPNSHSHFSATIHLNSEHCDLIHDAYTACTQGHYSQRPIIEMTVPSYLDNSLAPTGAHVVQLFTQYTPKLLEGKEWSQDDRLRYAKLVFANIDAYAPGFSESVIDFEVLTPSDLEAIFGLTGGNIFHGSMSLDQFYFMRPVSAFCDYTTPINGLYLCGSGSHPGGGVMGSAGRLCASQVLETEGRRWWRR